MRRASRGFSLVELMAVLAVLAVLAVAAMPLAELSWQRDRERELKRALWEIRDAIDAHKKRGRCGADREGRRWVPIDAWMYLRRAYHFAARARASVGTFCGGCRAIRWHQMARYADKAWGVRSSGSPPERPAPGADVFDVYSQSACRRAQRSAVAAVVSMRKRQEVSRSSSCWWCWPRSACCLRWRAPRYVDHVDRSREAVLKHNLKASARGDRPLPRRPRTPPWQPAGAGGSALPARGAGGPDHGP